VKFAALVMESLPRLANAFLASTQSTKVFSSERYFVFVQLASLARAFLPLTLKVILCGAPLPMATSKKTRGRDISTEGRKVKSLFFWANVTEAIMCFLSGSARIK
jgi:hypothetical protein